MCDYEDDIPMKSTDDFHTYNSRDEFWEADSNERLEFDSGLHLPFPDEPDLSPGDIDGYDDNPDAWGFDPFGPDADVWRQISK